MKHILIAIGLLLAIGSLDGHAEKKHKVVFEATVARVDKWGLIKLSCGVAINYRLAEYKVDLVRSGNLTPGEHILARHLACKGNELDDLKVGDKVFVEAELLKHPEKGSRRLPPNEADFASARKASKDGQEFEVPFKYEPAGLIRLNATKVAKLIYASHEE
jgi:hypothetical protein